MLNPWGHKALDTTERLNNKSVCVYPSGKESAWNAGDVGVISGSGRSPGEENDNPLQYSSLWRTPWSMEPKELDTTKVSMHACMHAYIYIYIFFFRFFSTLGYHKILNRVPCTVQ